MFAWPAHRENGTVFDTAICTTCSRLVHVSLLYATLRAANSTGAPATRMLTMTSCYTKNPRGLRETSTGAPAARAHYERSPFSTLSAS